MIIRYEAEAKKKISSKAASRMSDREASSVTDELNRMLSHGEFKVTPAQEAFLRYVVEKAIAGKTSRIEAYTIAT